MRRRDRVNRRREEGQRPLPSFLEKRRGRVNRGRDEGH